MTYQFNALRHFTRGSIALTGLAIAALTLSPVTATSAFAQIESVDPNDLIDADLDNPQAVARDEAQAARNAVQDAATDNVGSVADNAPIDADFDPGFQSGVDIPVNSGPNTNNDDALPGPVPGGIDADALPESRAESDGTFQKDDLIGAAEGVFGKGAKGLAGLIEDVLKKQGRPNGYIVGREAGGAFVVGLRYGSGTLYHAVEGERPVYWTGPSIGVDAGANAANSFTLVYNLYDTEDLYKRFGAGEGQAYLVGGFNASYLRRGNVVLIPIRVGLGARLGANIGYRKFSKKQRWFPF
jgi:hypothetical protein